MLPLEWLTLVGHLPWPRLEPPGASLNTGGGHLGRSYAQMPAPGVEELRFHHPAPLKTLEEHFNNGDSPDSSPSGMSFGAGLGWALRLDRDRQSEETPSPATHSSASPYAHTLQSLNPAHPSVPLRMHPVPQRSLSPLAHHRLAQTWLFRMPSRSGQCWELLLLRCLVFSSLSLSEERAGQETASRGPRAPCIQTSKVAGRGDSVGGEVKREWLLR